MLVFVQLVSSISDLHRPVFNLLAEPEQFHGYGPKKVLNQEIELIHDLEPVEVA
jgi:hypothetical protein